MNTDREYFCFFVYMLNWSGSSATCDDSKSGILFFFVISLFVGEVAGYQAGDA